MIWGPAPPLGHLRLSCHMSGSVSRSGTWKQKAGFHQGLGTSAFLTSGLLYSFALWDGWQQPGLHSLDARSTSLPVVTITGVSRHCRVSPAGIAG